MAENIEVTYLGEDGEMWLVTGSTDAHSAEEAIRQATEAALDQTLEAYFGADDLVELSFVYRTDWAWVSHSEDEFELIHGEQSGGLERFAGYMVTL